jgi:DNA repair photolyase
MFYPVPTVRAEYRLEPCRTALNRVKGMSFRWSLNPYMGCAHRCTFCFVRAFEQLADRPSDNRYGTSIRVKPNVVDVLRRELARTSWKREQVAVGTATDPYQPAEGHFRLTRGAIQAMSEARTPFGIITRGPLIVRDLDVLTEAATRADVSVTFSVPTLDREIWRLTEPGTPPPRQRLRALRQLVDAGIKASVGMAPILPGLSDDPRLLADVVRAARDAGATGVWANLLYLRPGTREHFLDHLARDWPELLPTYEHLYARGPYVTKAVAEPVKARVQDLTRLHEVADRRVVRLEPPPDLPIGAQVQAPGQLALDLPMVARPLEYRPLVAPSATAGRAAGGSASGTAGARRRA